MTTTIRPAKSLVILAADLLAMRAKELLAIIGPTKSDSVMALSDAIHMYTEARIDSEITESMDILLAPVDAALKICDEQSLEFEQVMQQIEAKFEETAAK